MNPISEGFAMLADLIERNYESHCIRKGANASLLTVPSMSIMDAKFFHDFLRDSHGDIVFLYTDDTPDAGWETMLFPSVVRRGKVQPDYVKGTVIARYPDRYTAIEGHVKAYRDLHL
jgi:hypothetical protein